jgi:hypothetical protein
VALGIVEERRIEGIGEMEERENGKKNDGTILDI